MPSASAWRNCTSFAAHRPRRAKIAVHPGGAGHMTDDGRARLETMVRTTNGFEIAETDLLIRGPGEFFGTRQSGELGFHVAIPCATANCWSAREKKPFCW